MKTMMCVAISVVGTPSLAVAGEPTPPRVDWQASAQNVQARVNELHGVRTADTATWGKAMHAGVKDNRENM
jgi:hypothetical protein